MFELVVIAAISTILVALLVLAFGVVAYRRGYRRGVEDGARIVMVCPSEDRWLD